MLNKKKIFFFTTVTYVGKKNRINIDSRNFLHYNQKIKQK